MLLESVRARVDGQPLLAPHAADLPRPGLTIGDAAARFGASVRRRWRLHLVGVGHSGPRHHELSWPADHWRPRALLFSTATWLNAQTALVGGVGDTVLIPLNHACC